MSIEQIVFYLFSTILILSSVMVISSKNTVHAALFLILAFFNCACIWMLAEAEFLAIALVLVYVGAVMVLFLFVVMMLDIDIAKMRDGYIRYLPVGILVGLTVLFEMWLIIAHGDYSKASQPVKHGANYSNTETLGSVLYTDYMFQFEVASVILLVAIIAAIALTHRKRTDTKIQNPSEQVKVKREDRVRIVKMDAEKI